MIFDHINYKTYLDLEFALRGFTLKEVCEKTGIQPPYLTKVLRHDAQLTEEQVFSLAKLFQLNEEETDYLFLLHRFARAENKSYKQKLKEKIHTQREKKLHFSNITENKFITTSDSDSMKLLEFFLSPNQQMILKALRIPKYRHNPYLLCNKIEVLESEIDDTLMRLDHLRLITRSNLNISVTNDEPQIRETHALIPHFHKNWRIEALKRYFPKHHNNLKITETISLNAKNFDLLRQKIQKLISEFAHEKTSDSPSQVVQLNIDLFEVC